MRPMACGDSRSPSTRDAGPSCLLCGGDKSGGSQQRFCRQLIDKADARFDGHLAAFKAEADKNRAKKKERKP